MKTLRTILLATALTVSSLAPVQAQWVVFDPQNYAQDLIQAARALQQINNQIQSLQNEAMMLQNMGTNLKSLNTSQLGTMVTALTQISTLMNQGQGIAFNVNATNTAFTQTYPQSYPNGTTATTLQADALKRWQDSMAAFQQTLTIQAQVAQNVQADTATLTSLTNASQGAVGNLQVSQATNQLLALSTKQQLQIQSLMAAQYRATALDQARNAEDQEEARSAFSTFLGNGSAYTPQ
jgi:P-type conjugative transfer protein TrbJ